MTAADRVTYFRSAAAFREWLKVHHADTAELWVGYHKRATGKPSLTWPESVDEALCFGWIDGLRKSVDDERYKIRFSPRKASSIWSAVNIRRVAELTKDGRMKPAGRKAFAARKENRSGIYAYEQRTDSLPEPYATQLRKHARAWEYFQAQRPSYRKLAMWWIVSAKREETREKRLQQLIADSAAGRLIPSQRYAKPGKEGGAASPVGRRAARAARPRP